MQYVKENLSPRNVFQALEFGILHENEALKVFLNYYEFLGIEITPHFCFFFRKNVWFC